MKPHHFITKILTLTLFISLMIGFVVLKSGCSKRMTYDQYLNQAARELFAQEPQEDLETSLQENKVDTVRIDTTRNYVITKALIPGSKSPYMAIRAEDIFKFIPSDSLPNDFQPDPYKFIYMRDYDLWRRIQMLRNGEELPGDKKTRKKKN